MTLVLLLSALPHETTSSSDDAARRARRIMEAYMHATGVPALQVAVGVHGRIVWSEGFGRADLSRGIPVTTTTRFRIASISKLMTGTLTAILARRGVLDLDRPLGDYVSDIPDAWQSITARMLVHHTSGIGHYRDDNDGMELIHYPTTRSALAQFRDRPLVHAPGTAEAYSSYAYTLLALAIEAATGRPFLDVMQQEVINPLGMRRTGPDDRGKPQEDLTAFYQMDSTGHPVPAPPVDLSGRWAGSGYLSTAEDLIRFGMAHTKPGFLDAATLGLIAQTDSLPGGGRTKEGFGWGPRTDWVGRSMLWGDGSTPGARGGLLVYPDEGVVVAILTNVRGAPLERGELQAIAGLFLAEWHGAVLGEPTLAGQWTGVLPASVPIDVSLDLKARTVSFSRWRSFTIPEAYAHGDTTWILPLDREGLFPLGLVPAGDSLVVVAPRSGWKFALHPRSPLRGTPQ